MPMQRAAILLVLAASTTGCEINSHKSGNNENVQIATPFGGLSVKTDPNAIAGNTGITAYPGAQIVPREEHEGNDGAADVNLSFGKFSLRVKAVTYRTADAPDKVISFYRKDLTRYGTVIQCRDKNPVGEPTRTAEGLTCEDEKHSHGTTMHSFSGNLELKTGSKQHQHIVTIDRQDTGTKIALIALDLPGKFSFDSDEDDKKQ